MPSYSFGPYIVRHPRRGNSSRLSEPNKSSLFVRRLVFNSLNFLQIPPNLRAPPVRDVTRTLSPVSSSQGIVTSLSDMSALCAHTRYHLHQGCTYLTHALSWKVLSLTKPKGMNRNPSAIILHYLLDIYMNELSTLVSGKVENVNKRTLLLLCFIIPYNSRGTLVGRAVWY